MCLAIPAQIVELQEAGMARVRVGESHTFLTASMMLLPEPPQIGDYVIVHAGFALHTLSPPRNCGLLDFTALFAHIRLISSPVLLPAHGPHTAAGSQHE